MIFSRSSVPVIFFPLQPEDMEVVVISPNMVHMANNIRETLLTHMSRGVHTSGRIQDEQLLNTVEADIHIRTNMYDVPRQVRNVNNIEWSDDIECDDDTR